MKSRDRRKYEHSMLAEATWREWRRTHPVSLGESSENLFKAGWASGQRAVLGLAIMLLAVSAVLIAAAAVLLIMVLR